MFQKMGNITALSLKIKFGNTIHSEHPRFPGAIKNKFKNRLKKKFYRSLPYLYTYPDLYDKIVR